MAFITLTVFLTFCLLVGVESASVSLSNNQLTLNGNGHIQFYVPKEAIWNGLSDGKKNFRKFQLRRGIKISFAVFGHFHNLASFTELEKEQLKTIIFQWNSKQFYPRSLVVKGCVLIYK